MDGHRHMNFTCFIDDIIQTNKDKPFAPLPFIEKIQVIHFKANLQSLEDVAKSTEIDVVTYDRVAM